MGRARYATVVACSFAAASGISSVVVATPSYTAIVLQPNGFGGSTYATGVVGTGRQVGYSISPSGDHALKWDGSAGGMVDVNPVGYYDTVIRGTDGAHQVGYGGVTTLGQFHALLWSGSASSAVDLHPAGYAASNAYGLGGGTVAGTALTTAAQLKWHAASWDVTTGLMTDLHPAGFEISFAFATNGPWVVGNGTVTGSSGESHALVWPGSAGSVVDLNPPAATLSFARGISGDLIVGRVDNSAALWVGPDHTYVDLGDGEAWATNGTYQVGNLGNYTHAALWAGSADSLLDLHQFLPDRFTASRAVAIDNLGNIVGQADGPDGVEAVMWVPQVPEPGAGVIVTICTAMGMHGRRKEAVKRTSVIRGKC